MNDISPGLRALAPLPHHIPPTAPPLMPPFLLD